MLGHFTIIIFQFFRSVMVIIIIMRIQLTFGLLSSQSLALQLVLAFLISSLQSVWVSIQLLFQSLIKQLFQQELLQQVIQQVFKKVFRLVFKKVFQVVFKIFFQEFSPFSFQLVFQLVFQVIFVQVQEIYLYASILLPLAHLFIIIFEVIVKFLSDFQNLLLEDRSFSLLLKFLEQFI